MPRPKSYNRDEAVEKACLAFWAHGYQALGVRELEQLTGLNQFAIRSEFGGKEALYLEALRFYSDAAINTAMRPLKAGGVSEIIKFLQDLVTEGSPTSNAWGCLVVNTGIENARVQSTNLEKETTRYWAALEGHFLQALKKARSNSEIASGVDIKATAKGLVTAVMGVHVQNRTSQSSDAGRDLVGLVCAQLKTPKAK